jgi:hypothetical protein
VVAQAVPSRRIAAQPLQTRTRPTQLTSSTTLRLRLLRCICRQRKILALLRRPLLLVLVL